LYNIREGDISSVEAFLGHSGSGRVFCRPEIATALWGDVRWLQAVKGEEVFALWPILSEYSQSSPPFSYYVGPIWSSALLAKSPSSGHSARRKIVEAFNAYFYDRDYRVLAETGPGDFDVRPFIWSVGSEQGASLWSIQPRFSAMITGLRTRSEEDLWSSLRSVRRQEVKRANREGSFYLSDTIDWQEVRELYWSVVGDMNSEDKHKVDQVLSRMRNLLGRKGVSSRVYRSSTNGAIASFALMVCDDKSANLILTLTAKSQKRLGMPALSMWETIIESKKLGMEVLDFNGANSPVGADEKHSYGAEPNIFFRLRMDG